MGLSFTSAQYEPCIARIVDEIVFDTHGRETLLAQARPSAEMRQIQILPKSIEYEREAAGGQSSQQVMTCELRRESYLTFAAN